MDVDHPCHHICAIYIDVELSCWAGPLPTGMKQEIIEIAFVEMDLAALVVTREKSCFVRPRRWEISDKCADLTGISSEDIRTARAFPHVLSAMTEEFQPSKGLCCAWGNDCDLIAETCRMHGLRSPLRNLVDLASLFHRLLLLRDQVSVPKALEILGLEFDGVPHSALIDARNTARVHAAVIRRMRGEPEPLPISTLMAVQPEVRSEFAQKLSKSLAKP